MYFYLILIELPCMFVALSTSFLLTVSDCQMVETFYGHSKKKSWKDAFFCPTDRRNAQQLDNCYEDICMKKTSLWIAEFKGSVEKDIKRRFFWVQHLKWRYRWQKKLLTSQKLKHLSTLRWFKLWGHCVGSHLQTKLIQFMIKVIYKLLHN
jgi:hypothetical protein